MLYSASRMGKENIQPGQPGREHAPRTEQKKRATITGYFDKVILGGDLVTLRQSGETVFCYKFRLRVPGEGNEPTRWYGVVTMDMEGSNNKALQTAATRAALLGLEHNDQVSITGDLQPKGRTKDGKPKYDLFAYNVKLIHKAPKQQ